MFRSKPVVAVLSLVLAGALALPACSAAPPPGPAAPGGGDACTARADKGKSEVLPVVEANVACTTDADCVTIPVTTNCFDVCTRAVNKQGVAAVEKAESQVNATTCATYKQDGCKLFPPPCMAPPAPSCKSGKCG